MKKLLVIALLLLIPALALAQDQQGQRPAPQSAIASDVFHFLAHICQAFAVGCAPDNIVTGGFVAYTEVFIPFAANCTRHYIITDTEGALMGYQTFTSPLPVGNNVLSIGFGLAPGVYKFISIVACDNGEAAVSDWYRFRVV